MKASAGELLAVSEDAESQFERGQRFEKGQGVSPDDVRAAECYLKATIQGHTAAQFNLGLRYGRGRGVLRNGVSAQQWLRKAAEQGHPGAQYHLGVHLYQDSKRLPQAQACEARIEGYKFVQLAERRRYRGADSALEFIALGISRQEVAEGNRRATGFTDCLANSGEPVTDLTALSDEAK